ncbi:MAG: DUF3179 domain-containing protein [Actinomycetota bacterium]
MTSPRLAIAFALAFALGACGGVRDAIRAQPAPAAPKFDPRELVDVLPPGAVPAIDRPGFESQASAALRLQPPDPVAVVRLGEDARAYPLAILVWHEIVNDTVGGVAVAVTYSPLAGAALAFRRSVEGRTLTFGASGKLYRSNLVMYDRETTSLWPQLVGGAVLGPLAGRMLEQVPLQIASFGDFRASYPDGVVLTAETGAARVYGATPYQGYDSRTAPSGSFFVLRADGRSRAMERVAGVAAGGEARAFPFSALRSSGGVIWDRIDGADVVVLWRPGTRSVLDSSLIADAHDVGSTGVFVPVLDGRRLEFTGDSEGFRDAQTGSSWTVLGVATGGPLKGSRLVPVTHAEALWFAWAAFNPATSVFGASS